MRTHRAFGRGRDGLRVDQSGFGEWRMEVPNQQEYGRIEKLFEHPVYQESKLRPFHLKLLGSAFLSVLFYLGIGYLSREFNWGEGYGRRPIVEYLLLYAGVFIFYAMAVFWTLRAREDARSLWLILLAGLAFRAILIPSNQIQEDDVYRYLWDGKVYANEVNPYKFAPDQITYFKQFMIREPANFAKTYDAASVRELEKLAKLKWENERALKFMERINHSHLPTIYPPMAQSVFKWAYQAKPDSIVAMRIAFLFFDLLAAGFLIFTLKALGKKKSLVLIYFWSPLIIKETFNSTHLDIIGIALLTGAIYCLVKMRFYWSHFFLALSVASKLYPVVLFPFFLKEQLQRRSEKFASPLALSALCASIFGGTILLLYLPFLDIGTKVFSSLKSFGTFWQSNDSIFAILVWFYRDALGFSPEGPVGFSYDMPSLLAKITVMALLGAVWSYLLIWSRRPEENLEHPSLPCIRHLFVLMGMIFCLSPVQNPWYLGWVVPFLCFFPMRSWILLTGVVGLYYLEFYFDYQNLFQYIPVIPWVEYLPFYAMLAWELLTRVKRSRNKSITEASSPFSSRNIS